MLGLIEWLLLLPLCSLEAFFNDIVARTRSNVHGRSAVSIPYEKSQYSPAAAVLQSIICKKMKKEKKLSWIINRESSGSLPRQCVDFENCSSSVLRVSLNSPKTKKKQHENSLVKSASLARVYAPLLVHISETTSSRFYSWLFLFFCSVQAKYV